MMNKLKDKKLIKHVVDEVQKEGVVGEEDSIIVLSLKIMLRLVNNASPTSSNVLVSDKTGGGKDWLTERVCKVLMPKNDCFHRTSMSPKIFNYWQPMKKDGKKTITLSWDGRVIYLEDPEEELIKSQAFKVMASGGTHMTVVKDQKVLDREIIGKPVIIVTSMKTQIDVEGQRRWDAIRIDTSQQLSDKVIDSVLTNACGKSIKGDADVTFRSLLQELDSYTVVIPWAMQLKNVFQNPRMIERTQTKKFLDYIKASAVLHQEQREKDDDGNLLANYDDYELARFAYIQLRNKEGNALNKQEEILLDYLRDNGGEVKLNQVTSELENVSRTWLYDNKDNMIEKGVISTTVKFDAGANREVEHLKASEDMKKIAKNPPRGDKLLNKKSYLLSGSLYKEINTERQKDGLLPIFKEMI